jgi:hypothetical protein
MDQFKRERHAMMQQHWLKIRHEVGARQPPDHSGRTLLN